MNKHIKMLFKYESKEEVRMDVQTSLDLMTTEQLYVFAKKIDELGGQLEIVTNGFVFEGEEYPKIMDEELDEMEL